MDEMLSTYDKHGEFLANMPRDYCDSKSFKNYIKVVYVWIVTDDCHILIQQRSAIKKVDPLKWDGSVGGHVDADETSLDAAQRETFEELGIDAPQSDFIFLKQFKSNYYHSFNDIYLLKAKSCNIKLTLATDEVNEIRWVTNNQLKQIIFTNQFCKHNRKYKRWVLKTIGKNT